MSGNTQRLTILAQDPATRIAGKLVLASIEIPHEVLADGPVGYRVKVVDFNASTNVLYRPLHYKYDANGNVVDPFALPKKAMTDAARAAFDVKLLADPNFHAQHTYAVVMRILARFEYALGRRVKWGFDGHQLHVAPHAFCEANAFYSEEDRALLFGYFYGKNKAPVFTCLSHDIVAHETTHALLDGLRNRYTDASGPDQAAFHEGFSDVVALLSMFSLKPIVLLALTQGKGKSKIKSERGVSLINGDYLTAGAIADSILFGIGEEFGQQLEGVRANALRRSVKLPPSKRYLADPDKDESHVRGEVFAAAFLRSFLALWVARIEQLGTFGANRYNVEMVVDEGAKVAEQLLTMAIRALDYCPPVDIVFSQYLAALLTVDREVAPDDSRFDYRVIIRKTFASYGIEPPTKHADTSGCWNDFDPQAQITYSKTHFESMLRDEEEVFRFIWENRAALNIDDRGYLQVISVRPSTRQGPDGFILRETICEYIQIAELFGAELKAVLGFERPDGMRTTQRIKAYGGGVLVFDQYGRIKYHIERRLDDIESQQARLEFLWKNGYLDQPRDARNQFAAIHRARAQCC